MALSNILRRSASSVVPLAVRVIGSQKYHHSAAIFCAVNHSNISHRSSCPSVLHYSTTSFKSPSVDESLLKVIHSEIKWAEESDDYDQVEAIPKGFPFKIEDNPRQRTISLTREHQGETIKVEVHMPDLITGEEDDDNKDDDDDSRQTSVPLVVSVCKHDGGPFLEFGCTAFADEISIDSLSVRDPEISEDPVSYDGPDFADLDDNLQNAFHKYLQIRGLRPSTTNFLPEYMINKDSREYLIWLKNVKKFIEE